MYHPDMLYRLGKIKQEAALKEAEAARLAAEARRRNPTPSLLTRLLVYFVMLLTFMLRLGQRAPHTRNDQTFLIVKSRTTESSTSLVIGARIMHR